MDDDGVCRGIMAWNLDDGTMHRFRANTVVMATGGYGRAYFSCTGAHTQTGDGSLLLVNHSNELAARMDRIVRLTHGRLVEDSA